VVVTAGESGSVSLFCSMTYTDLAFGSRYTCWKPISIGPSPASLAGPASVLEGSATNTFTLNGAPAGSSYEWSITGNGTIVGPAVESVVQVEAGDPGAFTLTGIFTHDSGAGSSEKTVTVNATPPSEPGLNENAALMIHLIPASGGPSCAGAGPAPPCTDTRISGSLHPQTYHAALLVMDGYTNGGRLSGISEVRLGLDYNAAPSAGVDILGWTACADWQIPGAGWPEAGSGNRIGWNPETNCQRTEPGGPGTGVVAVAGYFYLSSYTPDRLSLTSYPGEDAVMVDCQSQTSTLAASGSSPRLGYAEFGGGAGYRSCRVEAPISVRRTTWGAIKAMYGQ
jgi:hypothetical protein